MNTILLILGGGLVLILTFLAMLKIFSWKKKKIGENGEDKNMLVQAKVIVYAGFGIIFLLFVSGIIVHAVNSKFNFLMNLSVTIILSWIILLICYYTWAIYFYNVNMGWSNERWDRSRWRQEDPTATEGITPQVNPHGEETLGLPPGTVRGTIALTLLVGGLALTVASFSMDRSVKESVILIDNFDFYKKAFLMMIAFYFGTKSLELLQSTPAATPAAAPEAKTDTTVKKEIDPQAFQKDFNDATAKG